MDRSTIDIHVVRDALDGAVVACRAVRAWVAVPGTLLVRVLQTEVSRVSFCIIQVVIYSAAEFQMKRRLLPAELEDLHLAR